MKIIKNNYIPFKGYVAMNLFGILFTRKDNLSDVVINHEYIHTKQMREMLYIPFYIWYGIEWLIRLFNSGNPYRNISFEREAYANEYDMDYANNRKPYAWLKYINV